jgi:uncharacterized protein DUF1707
MDTHTDLRPQSKSIRVSDSDRGVADQLAREFATGRLNRAEFDARLDRALTATTRAELDVMFDLPPAAVNGRPRPLERYRRPLMLAVLPFALSVIGWFAIGRRGGFWPKWVAVATVIALARAAFVRSVFQR